MAADFCSEHKTSFPTWFLCLECAVDAKSLCDECARKEQQCKCKKKVRRPTWTEAVSFGVAISRSADSFFERDDETNKRRRRQ